jgi:hypothetical protein
MIKSVFKEFINEATFPLGTDIGPSTDNMSYRAGGIAGDWIVHDLGIPATEAEIGAWTDFYKNWFPKNSKIAKNILDDNLKWLEYTYEKIGNQIKIDPVGFKIMKRSTKEIDEARMVKYKHINYKAVISIKVTNQGLSDQIFNNIKIRVQNKNLVILPEACGIPDLNEVMGLMDKIQDRLVE